MPINVTFMEWISFTMGYTLEDPTFYTLEADPDIFKTLGLELLQGRNFNQEYSEKYTEYILNEQGMKYKYIDVDKIEFSDKAKILEYLRTNFQDRISYPFLICESGHVVGYDPKKYMQLLMEGGE